MRHWLASPLPANRACGFDSLRSPLRGTSHSLMSISAALRFPASSLLWRLSTRPHDAFPAFSPQPSKTTRFSRLSYGCGRGIWEEMITAHAAGFASDSKARRCLKRTIVHFCLGPQIRLRLVYVYCLRQLSRCSSRDDSDFHWLISWMCARTSAATCRFGVRRHVAALDSGDMSP